MTGRLGMTRADFLKACGAAAAGAALGCGHQRTSRLRAPSQESARFKSWEIAEYPSLPGKRKQVVRISAGEGAFGISPVLEGGPGISLKGAEAVLREANLLDHEKLYDLMIERGLSRAVVKVVDIACWDLHARMRGKPLHALLGTKREKVLRYGDVRGTQPGFTPEKYARSVAGYLGRTGLKATKLHFPGAMGTEDSIPFKDVLETLRAVRAAVGGEKILAWDPYPRSAESATPSLDEAREILGLMKDLDYAWIEGPLPPVPFETQIPRYAELMKAAKIRIQAEGPGSPIGDGTSFEVMKRWVEAGAVNQCSTDAYIAVGLTNAIRMLEYARSRADRPLVINLHWAWAPHAHLAMAYDEKILPVVEFPGAGEVPPGHVDRTHLLAPDWPGIYRLE